MRFHCAIRPAPHYRRDAFLAGMKRVGWREAGWGACDVFVTWNRYGLHGDRAAAVERRGGLVLVTENAAWGNGFAGDHWYTIARDAHNTAGKFPVGFGDYKRGYLLVDRVGLRMTRDNVTNVGFVRFYVRRRVGGIVLNNDAIKYIRT